MSIGISKKGWLKVYLRGDEIGDSSKEFKGKGV
jgi:hypothetical protein